MGTILNFTCRTCGYEKRLYTGGGMLDCNIDTIMSALSKHDRAVLYDAINNGAKYITINREPCCCSLCNELFTVPKVSYYIHENEQIIYGECPYCGKADHSPADICPKCGGKLTSERIGLWD